MIEAIFLEVWLPVYVIGVNGVGRTSKRVQHGAAAISRDREGITRMNNNVNAYGCSFVVSQVNPIGVLMWLYRWDRSSEYSWIKNRHEDPSRLGIFMIVAMIATRNVRTAPSAGTFTTVATPRRANYGGCC